MSLRDQFPEYLADYEPHPALDETDDEPIDWNAVCAESRAAIDRMMRGEEP